MELICVIACIIALLVSLYRERSNDNFFKETSHDYFFETYEDSHGKTHWDRDGRLVFKQRNKNNDFVLVDSETFVELRNFDQERRDRDSGILESIFNGNGYLVDPELYVLNRWIQSNTLKQATYPQLYDTPSYLNYSNYCYDEISDKTCILVYNPGKNQVKWHTQWMSGGFLVDPNNGLLIRAAITDYEQDDVVNFIKQYNEEQGVAIYSVHNMDELCQYLGIANQNINYLFPRKTLMYSECNYILYDN